jgi:hypothetical protein
MLVSSLCFDVLHLHSFVSFIFIVGLLGTGKNFLKKADSKPAETAARQSALTVSHDSLDECV